MTISRADPTTPRGRGRHHRVPVAKSRRDVGGRKPGLSRRRVRTPTILQMEAVECGAASLAMVLAYHGSHLGLQRLRHLCGVSRDGSKAGDLVKAARVLGLEAGGRQMSLEVLGKLQPPAIIFWEFNHYVVWEGNGRRFGKPVVYVNDPARGRRALTPEEFSAGFTGIVLVMKPGPDFIRGGKPPSTFADIPSRFRGTYAAMLIALLCGVMLVGVNTVLPAFTRGFIDSIMPDAQGAPLLGFFGLMGTAVLLNIVLVHMQGTYLLRAQMSAATLNTARFLRHLLRLPVAFFGQRSPADVAQRLGMNRRVAEALSQTVSAALVNALVVVLFAVSMWSYSPELALIVISISLAHLALMHGVVRLRSNGVAKLKVDWYKLVSTSYSGLQLIESMKASGGERGYFRRWGDHQAALLYQQQVIALPSALLGSLGPLLTTVSVAAILAFGGAEAVAGQLSIGLLIAFQVTLANFSRPVNELAGLAPAMQDAAADVARLRDVETTSEDALFSRPEPGRSNRLAGRVRFNAVTFGYGRLAAPLLDEFSFEVAPGQQVALVGGSGSGKTTVSRLIAGLYEPWSGTIEFDGRPHSEVGRSVLAASVAFVDQEVFLFAGTIRENVTLWDPSITDEAVARALRDACIDDVVADRPGGMHSRVEQDAHNFSGGQRQRLEIARALAGNPSVLVLDEATSALDAETEQRIIANLRRRGCACIVIAHRLSTVRSSDEILVLNAGRVIERGTHHQLLARQGAYAALAKES